MTYAVTQGSGLNFSSTIDNSSEHHSNHVMEFVDGNGKPVKSSATNPFPFADQAASSGGSTPFHSRSLNSTATNISSGTGRLFGFDCYNSNTSVDAWVKFYDKDAASVNPATPDIPFLGPYAVPANTGVSIKFGKGIQFSTKISVRMVTGLADNATSAPSANDILFNAEYK